MNKTFFALPLFRCHSTIRHSRSMTRGSMLASVLALCCASFSPLALAVPDLQGDVKVVVTTEEVVNIATDQGSIAEIIIGSFIDGKANNFEATVSTKTVTNSASGGACAQIMIGSVGSSNCQ
jgi:hypothetical protein